MQSGSYLHNVSIVLVNTKTPSNIGAAARSMMNMGLARLVLVNPPKDESQEALKLAAGAGRVVLEALVVDTLAEAIIGQHLVIGTSRHPGRLRRNIRSPREMADEAVPLLAHNKVSIVFGNEVNGLVKKDLALCQEIIAIPTSEAFPSLNLSHAVMVVAYEFFIASQTAPSSTTYRELVRAEDLEGFYLHLQETLTTIEFLDRNQPERMMASLRQIFGRARLESRDVSILHGILSATDRTCTRKP